MGATSKPPPLAQFITGGGGKFFTGSKHPGHPWSGWPSSAAAAHGRHYYWTSLAIARQVCIGDSQTNDQIYIISII